MVSNAGNGFSESLILKIFLGSMPPDLPRASRPRRELSFSWPASSPSKLETYVLAPYRTLIQNLKQTAKQYTHSNNANDAYSQTVNLPTTTHMHYVTNQLHK